MNTVGALLDQIRSHGFSLQLVNEKVRIQGSKQPDAESLVLIDELRKRREDVKAFLTDTGPKPKELSPSVKPHSVGCKCAASINQQLRVEGDVFDWMCGRCGKTLHVPEAQLKKTDPIEGGIVAVEICSEVLQTHVWLAFDESFDPKDGRAVFYGHELELLRTKTPEQLREICRVKEDFGPRSRVTKPKDIEQHLSVMTAEDWRKDFPEVTAG
jgi:hypothetical protein